MKIRALKSWRRLTPGKVVDYPDGMANVLCKRGICERVEEERPQQAPIQAPLQKFRKKQ